jgi:hypothetical protein
LIELALGTDKIIVSLDETAREAFRKASQSVADLRSIFWVNPTLPEDKALEWLKDKAHKERYETAQRGFDLRLMSSLKDVSGIPRKGKDLIIVAVVNNVLHFLILDGDGKVVVDTDEQRLPEQARQTENLRKRLASLWPPHELTGSDKGRLTAAVTSILGHTTQRLRLRSKK